MRNKWYLAPLAIVAIGLLSVGGFGTTRAALSVRSDPYLTRIETESVSTALLEAGTNGRPERRSGEGDLLQDLEALNVTGLFTIGQDYERGFAVENDGTLPEYVRASVYRYWTDEEGRRVDLDPSLIDLRFSTQDGWHMDETASETSERTVLWYDRMLYPGQKTPAFTRTFAIDRRIASESARYGSVQFHVEVVVDAVQTHNAQDAMRSAWGHAYEVIEEEEV